jgi:hypothetical protein
LSIDGAILKYVLISQDVEFIDIHMYGGLPTSRRNAITQQAAG